MALLRIGIALLALAAAAFAQEEPVPGEKPSAPPVRITFTPPDLDGRIVLGIFGPDGKLVRTLRPQPATPDLKIDTNGYIAEWDGLDETGAACPSGRYSARGYVVGGNVSIEGEAYHFNDWMAMDGLAVTGVELGPWFGVELAIAGETAPRVAKIDEDGGLEFVPSGPAAESMGDPAALEAVSDLPVQPIFQTKMADGTRWVIFKDGEQNVVSQVAADGTALREFREPKGEPQPVEMVAGENAILLRETAGDVVRVRMLKRTDVTATEGGKVVSDWEVVFERELEPCAEFGIRDGKVVAKGGLPSELAVRLVPNVLIPRAQELKLGGEKAGEGSAIIATDGGLPLLKVSDRGGWNRFALIGGGEGAGTFYQGNGLVVEEFSIRHLDEIAAFDAGAFLLESAAE